MAHLFVPFMGFIHQPSWFQSRFHLGKIIESFPPDRWFDRLTDRDVFKPTRVQTNEFSPLFWFHSSTSTCFVGILLEFSSTDPADPNTCSELESAEEAPDHLGWDEVHVVRVEHLASEMCLGCSQNPLQCLLPAGPRWRRVPVVFILVITSDSGLLKSH